MVEHKMTVHEKSRGETINIYVDEYKGTKYLHIREWYVDKDQESKPSKKGVAIPLDKLDSLLDALKELKTSMK